MADDRIGFTPRLQMRRPWPLSTALCPLGIRALVRLTRDFKLAGHYVPDLGGVGYGVD
jgi:hypothetical protein